MGKLDVAVSIPERAYAKVQRELTRAIRDTTPSRLIHQPRQAAEAPTGPEILSRTGGTFGMRLSKARLQFALDQFKGQTPPSNA